MQNDSWLPKLLFVAYVAVFVLLGVRPYDRAVWIAENIPIVAIAALLALLYWRRVRFSNLAYAMMAVLLFWHTVGGYYTFERVPFDWFDNLFGFKRNMYDRVGHFTVGFYAFAVAEYIETRRLANTRWITYLMPFFFVATVAMGYELIEWAYAELHGGSAGAAFLGSQGDVWDAQKDMLMDVLGALFALGIYRIVSVGRTKHPRTIVVASR